MTELRDEKLVASFYDGQEEFARTILPVRYNLQSIPAFPVVCKKNIESLHAYGDGCAAVPLGSQFSK
jgi:hypothetical protein